MFLSKLKRKEEEEFSSMDMGLAQQRALDTLEEKMYSRPVRAYADFKKAFYFAYWCINKRARSCSISRT